MVMDMVQKRIIKNKVEKGFNTTDIEKEFAYLSSEVAEALDAYRNESVGRVAEELADIAIYTLGIAELLNIDMEHAIEYKMKMNENRVYVNREDGTPVKLGKIYLPSGSILGTPFGKVKPDSEGVVDREKLRKTISKFDNTYFEYPYTLQDLGNLILVRFDENDVEQRKLYEIDVMDQNENFGSGIKCEKLFDFFKIDSARTKIDDVEFILLYKECMDVSGNIDYIKYYLTYLQSYDSFI